MVPSGLVPAVLFHENEEKNTTRTLVWESNDILYALDAMFPETTPQLMKAKGTDAAFDAALELQVSILINKTTMFSCCVVHVRVSTTSPNLLVSFVERTGSLRQAFNLRTVVGILAIKPTTTGTPSGIRSMPC